MEILLNSLKNIRSVNVDNYQKIAFSNQVSLLTEYNINNALSATEVFDAEREANEIYRVYGKIEYLSLLNNIKSQYNSFQDFFQPQPTGNTKTILNSFKFYLVRPASSGYTQIQGNTQYIRYFQVLATPNDFEIYPAGFSNNLYGDQAFAFSFNKDFDVSQYLDGFGFPLTELFLYAQYIPSTSPSETIEAVSWNSTTGIKTKFGFTPKNLNINDYVQTTSGEKLGDLIDYSRLEFFQTQLAKQTFYIKTPYGGNHLIWKYNPLIPLRLRYFNSILSRGNTGSTSYDLVRSIPYYALPVDSNGNMVWRTILPQGYVDPLSGLGVDYPFVNKCRYLFSNIILDVVPDLTDSQTYAAFTDIWFSRYSSVITHTPTGDLNDIGKPCK